MNFLTLSFNPLGPFFTDYQIIEYINIETIDRLISSGHLLEYWKPEGREYAMNEITHLKTLKKQIEIIGKKTVLVPNHKKKSKFGRCYASKNMTMVNLRGKVKNTLLKDLYLTFDIKNCHYSILLNIANKLNIDAGIECKIIPDYVANQEKYFKLLQDEYGTDKKTNKQLMIKLLYGGSFNTWLIDNNIEKSKIKLDFINILEYEISELLNMIIKLNQLFYETVKRNIKNKNKTEKEKKASFFGLYLQELDFQVVNNAIIHLIEKTEILNYDNYYIVSYEYDGFSLIKDKVLSYGLDKLIVLLNDITLNFGFNLTWVTKEIDDGRSPNNCSAIDDYYDFGTQPSYIHKSIQLKENTTICTELENLKNELKGLKSSMAIANYIYKQDEFKTNFLYNRNEWYEWNGEYWSKNRDNLYFVKVITTLFIDHLKNKIKDFEIYKPDIKDEKLYNVNNTNYMDCIKSITSIEILTGETSKINSIIELSKNNYKNDTIIFDNNEFLVCFNNGVYDVKKHLFRPLQYDDYLTLKANYDFRLIDFKNLDLSIEQNKNDNETYNELNKILNQIFIDEDIKILVMVILSSCFIGVCIEKFIIFNGGGANGKSLLNLFNKNSLGDDYYYKADNSILQVSNKSTGGTNQGLANCHNKRCLIFSELDKSKTIKISEMKNLTGGGNITARGLYSKNDVVKLTATSIIEVNVKPLLDDIQGTDTNSLIRRIIDILFSSKFTFDKDEIDNITVFEANIYYKSTEFLDKIRVIFTNIIFDYLQLLHKQNYNIDYFIPNSIKKRSLDYIQSSNTIHNIFIELFEEDKEDNSFIKIDDVISTITSSVYFNQLTKKQQGEFKNSTIKEYFKMNDTYKKSYYERKRINGNYYRNIIMGYKIKTLTDDED